MGRTKKGGAVRRRGQWYGRASYLDPVSGKQKFRERLSPTNTKTEAKRIGAELAREIEAGALTKPPAERTLEDLAAFYESHYMTEAVYVDGHKVSGLRSLPSHRTWLKPIKAYFGKRKLSTITYASLLKYRVDRLAVPAHGRSRAIGSVNRELAVLHRMFAIAVQEGWLVRSPFAAGKSLLEPSREKKRERVISEAEELRLLGACTSPRFDRLRGFLIALIDTGCRKNEIQTLRWSDVDLLSRSLTIRMENTKAHRERRVPVPSRLASVLQEMRTRDERSDGLVFGALPQHQFVIVRKAAGLPDVRLHDLRHTTATRLVAGGMELAEVGRILGHTQPSMTYRYVSSTDDTIQRAADILSGGSEGREDSERVN